MRTNRGSLAGAPFKAGYGLRFRLGVLGEIILELAQPILKPRAETYAFQGYRSAFLGEGDPPDDQARRVRIRTGEVNAKVPSNCHEEFVVPASSTRIFYVTGTFSEDGTLVSVEIGTGTATPDDPAPEAGVAPSTQSRGLFEVVTNATQIVSISPIRKGSLDVHKVVTDVDCGTNTYDLQWTSSSAS